MIAWLAVLRRDRHEDVAACGMNDRLRAVRVLEPDCLHVGSDAACEELRHDAELDSVSLPGRGTTGDRHASRVHVEVRLDVRAFAAAVKSAGSVRMA
jgi:hypothetical protein